MNLILIGAQGSGKGTQAELLTETFGITHVASGDLFRQALEEHTPLGLQARAYLERGELVPDEVTLAMVLDHITLANCPSGFLLDGFPRTISQGVALDNSLGQIGQRIDAVIYMEVAREALFERLSGRLICHAHQHVYNINTHPPKVPGICDIDGSELYQRSDDQGDAIHKRLDIFFHETIQLIDHYTQQNKLITVNGDLDINAVHQELVEVLENKYHLKEIPHPSTNPQ